MRLKSKQLIDLCNHVSSGFAAEFFGETLNSFLKLLGHFFNYFFAKLCAEPSERLPKIFARRTENFIACWGRPSLPYIITLATFILPNHFTVSNSRVC